MDDRDDERRHAGGVEAPGLSPVRAFLVVCVLATAVGGALFATRDASPSEPSPTTPRSPDYTLTDAEAIAEFERLYALATATYRERDVSLIKTFAVPDSAFARTVEREVRTLLRDGVLDETRSRWISEEVLTNSASVIEVEQVLVERPKFIDARTGRDLTVRATMQEQTVVWTIELWNGRWLFSGATITAAEPASK